MENSNRRELVERAAQWMRADLDALNQQGSQQFLAGSYASARKLAEQAQQLADLIRAAEQALEGWLSIIGPQSPPTEPAASNAPLRLREVHEEKHRAYQGRLQGGKCHPQEFYRVPILQALILLDGSAPRRKVFDTIFALIGGQLNEFDKALLDDGWYTRWMNMAAWERQSLVHEGLLKPSITRGWWQISDAGRQYLEAQEQKERQNRPLIEKHGLV